jgi:hypothetical protein
MDSNPVGNKAGSPGGNGNPPGKYDEGYLDGGDKEDHFVNKASYRGDMHIGGISDSSPDVGNQPKQEGDGSLESFANKEDSIHQVNSSKV